MASTNPEIRNRRQRRRHPYPAQHRFPPTEAGENNADPPAPQQNQVDGVVEARVGHREFIFIVSLLLLRLFVAFILHGNAIRALTENSDPA